MHNRQQLEEEAVNGFEKLYDIIRGRSFNQLANKPKHVNALKTVTLKFNDNIFLKIKKIIGEGFWSYVFLVDDFNDGSSAPKVSVIKILRPSHADVVRNSMYSLANMVIDPKKQFIKEAAIYKDYFNYGEVVIRKVYEHEICALVMPYLGNLTITKLISDTFYLSHVPLEEWLLLLIECTKETYRFHHDSGYVHYDIKPSNFLVSPVSLDDTSLFKLTDVKLIDGGQATKPNHTGSIGDLRYAPLIRSAVGMFYVFKDHTVDKYHLGKTLLDIIYVLLQVKSFQHPQVKKILIQCQKNAQSLVAQFFPAKLKTVIKEFERIRLSYINSEKCPFIQLSTELQQLRAKLDSKVKLHVNCCMPIGQNLNCLFSKNPAVSIKQTTEAIDKLLDLIAEKDVEFNEQDMHAYAQGELGDIITHYRLEGKLPRVLNEIERKSISISEHAGRYTM